jgi:hypothetical protein
MSNNTPSVRVTIEAGTVPAEKPPAAASVAARAVASGSHLAHVWGEIAFRVPSGARISSGLLGFLSEARRCSRKV